MDAIASGLGAHVNHRIPLARGARIENFVVPRQPQRESIHQGIAGIAIFESRFAAHIGHTKAIAVGSDPTYHTLQNRMILVND